MRELYAEIRSTQEADDGMNGHQYEDMLDVIINGIGALIYPTKSDEKN